MYEDGLGAPAVDPVTVEATFSAKYPGECPSCGLAISEGQRIAKLSTERYVHVGCAP